MDSSAPLKRIETLPVVDDAGQYAAPFAGYYTVPQYNTMTIPQQYDLPFAKQRKSIAQAFGFAAHELSHPWGDALKTPHADIRETKSAYYIDIDLPGLDDKKSVVIKWTQKRSTDTLFVQAITKRPEIPGESEDDVTVVHAGRHVGNYARAFAFPVDVVQEKTTAKLAFGTVRLVVMKKSGAAPQQHEVEVEHEGQ